MVAKAWRRWVFSSDNFALAVVGCSRPVPGTSWPLERRPDDGAYRCQVRKRPQESLRHDYIERRLGDVKGYSQCDEGIWLEDQES